MSMLFALPAQPKVAGVLFGSVIVWYLIRLHFWKKYILSGPLWVMVPGIIWIAVLAVALTWSPDTKLGWRITWAQRWIVLITVLWPLMSRWKILLLSVLLGCILQSITQFIQGTFDIGPASISGLSDHPRRPAAWQASVIIGMLTLYLSGILRSKWWLLTLIPVSLGILISHSRGAILATAISIPAVIILLASTKSLVASRLWSIAALIAIVAVFSTSYIKTLGTVFNRAYQSSSIAITDGELSDPRLIMWSSSYRQWKNHPLFGYGTGGTKEAFEQDPHIIEEGDKLAEYEHTYTYKNQSLTEITRFNQPHSIYFQVLIENGIVGVLAGGFLITMTTMIGWRTAKHHPLGTLGLSVLLVWLITGAFDSWYSQGQSIALFWFAATIASIHPFCYQEQSNTHTDKSLL